MGNDGESTRTSTYCKGVPSLAPEIPTTLLRTRFMTTHAGQFNTPSLLGTNTLYLSIPPNIRSTSESQSNATMAPLKTGDKFPEDVKFECVSSLFTSTPSTTLWLTLQHIGGPPSPTPIRQLVDYRKSTTQTRNGLARRSFSSAFRVRLDRYMYAYRIRLINIARRLYPVLPGLPSASIRREH